jgi:hypothetical protein
VESGKSLTFYHVVTLTFARLKEDGQSENEKVSSTLCNCVFDVNITKRQPFVALRVILSGALI